MIACFLSGSSVSHSICWSGIGKGMFFLPCFLATSCLIFPAMVILWLQLHLTIAMQDGDHPQLVISFESLHGLCNLLDSSRWEEIYLNTNFFLLQKKVSNSTKGFLGLVMCRELLLLEYAHLYLLQPPQLRVSNKPVNLNRRFPCWRKILSVSLVQRSRTPWTQSFKKQQMLRKRHLINFLLMPYFCSILW